MKSEDLILRTKNFAYSCIDLTEDLVSSYLANHVKSQLIRCSSSVAANYRATCHAQSKASFVAKLSIVIEECDESEFWLQLIKDKNLLKNEIDIDTIIKEGYELTSIFVVSRKSASISK